MPFLTIPPDAIGDGVAALAIPALASSGVSVSLGTGLCIRRNGYQVTSIRRLYFRRLSLPYQLTYWPLYRFGGDQLLRHWTVLRTLWHILYRGLGMNYEAGICTIVISMNEAFQWSPVCCRLNFDPKSMDLALIWLTAIFWQKCGLVLHIWIMKYAEFA